MADHPATAGAAFVGRRTLSYGILPLPEVLRIEDHPDNLARSPRGTILVVSHLSGPAVLLCGWGRRPCRSGWALIEIEPDLSSAIELLRHDGEVVGAAASAAEVAGRLYIGAVFDDRVGVWQPSM